MSTKQKKTQRSNEETNKHANKQTNTRTNARTDKQNHKQNIKEIHTETYMRIKKSTFLQTTNKRSAHTHVYKQPKQRSI